jgi:nucleoid-associated protein YgaU
MGLFDIFRKKDDNERDSATAAPPVGRISGRTYTVSRGDTLASIAQREYGDSQQWVRIYDANRDFISNPDVLYPGQRLRLP